VSNTRFQAMRNFDVICLKVVRWSSWPLLVLLLGFFVTGYGVSGRYGMGLLMSEQAALAFHKLLHVPLIVLTVAHSLPAIYLAMQRWGWIKR
jgi:hypothetical protein